MQENQPKSIQWLSERIEINLADIDLLEQRSQAFTVQGMVDQAISDCTKLIHLDTSREYYVQRSQLFWKKGKYSDSLRDLSTAKTLERESEHETAADVYLQNSICMKNIKEVQQMAHIVESEYIKQGEKIYGKTLKQLLQVKDVRIKEIQESRQKEIAELKRYYDEQNKLLKELLLKQLNEMKEKVNNVYINYQAKFQKELNANQLTDLEKNKLKLYFQNVSSEMEKYYIAAKNLHKIEDKTIKFQDFQNIMVNKKSSEVLKKLYKFFDKYSSQVQKIEDLIKEIPYIGTAFKIVKGSMKAKGWVQEINIQNECQNIQRVAINTTAFNELSTNLAYYLVKHYQKQILEEKEVFKTKWELLTLRIKKLKEANLGVTQYRHILTKQQEIVKDYAIIHASIIMIAFACNQLHFDKHVLSELNKLYENNKQDAMTMLAPVLKVINEVETALKCKIAEQSQTKQKSSSNSYSCSIY